MLRFSAKDTAVFEITLSQPSAVPVTVDYTTMDDGSADNSDYTGVSGTLTFPPGVATRTIRVPTIDDATGESSETFQLVLSNPSGASITNDTAIATIIDDDPNNAPVAVDDSVSAESDVEQIIDVLANDSDPEGDPIAIDSVESPTANGGNVIVNPDNTLSYTSAPGFTGSDSFTYTISDGQGGTATATVTVDVAEATETAMFVADISFQSRKGNKEWRAIFEVRDEFGGAVVGASITVTFAGQTYSGQTDGNGQFRTGWRPVEDDIKSARKSLTKMKPEYTVEFISLMARFQAAQKKDVVELLRTPTIKKLIGKYRRRIDEQLDLLDAEERSAISDNDGRRIRE